VLQMETPRRVWLLSEDGLWVAVEGSETGIPMNQISVLERVAAPPTNPLRFAINAPKAAPTELQHVSECYRSEKFDADEGVITTSWPSNLSAQSVEDMQAWVELLMKRIERRAKASDEGKVN
jgi:hypothetical protein